MFDGKDQARVSSVPLLWLYRGALSVLLSPSLFGDGFDESSKGCQLLDHDQNHDGKLTFGEIYQYVSNRDDGVPFFARRINGVQQNPQIMGANRDMVFFEYK